MLVVEVFSLQKVFKLIEVAVVGRHRGRGQVNTADEAKFCSPICSTFEAVCHTTNNFRLCDIWLGVVMEKSGAHSFDHCQQQAL